MVIANVAAALTVAPLVPIQEMDAVPTVAVPEAANVITDVPPACATGFVPKVVVTPNGCPVQDGTIPALRPVAVNVAVEVIDAPCATVPEVGERAVVSVGVAPPVPFAPAPKLSAHCKVIGLADLTVRTVELVSFIKLPGLTTSPEEMSVQANGGTADIVKPGVIVPVYGPVPDVTETVKTGLIAGAEL